MDQVEQNITNEFSFRLKPAQHGVGVFATHDIKKGTYLRLFGEEQEGGPEPFVNCRFLKKEDIPEPFLDFCVSRGRRGLLICPKDFSSMEVGWFLNHSKDPNVIEKNYYYYACRDISADEELTIDYNTLEEPGEEKDDFYK